ncbi:hypothetical protein D3C74_501920 [compost metagenome]
MCREQIVAEPSHLSEIHIINPDQHPLPARFTRDDYIAFGLQYSCCMFDTI